MAAPDLDEVSNEKTAEGLDLCGENGTRYQVPWGVNPLAVCLAEDAQGWPELLRQYPVRHIQQIPPMGPPQLLENFTPDIAADWLAHQIEQNCAEPPGTDDGGGEGTGDGGADPGGGTGDAGQTDGAGAVGCGCRSSDDTPVGFGFGFGLLGLAILRRSTRLC
jgi:MYXO-CTERM domain-containing protein